MFSRGVCSIVKKNVYKRKMSDSVIILMTEELQNSSIL